MAEFRNSENSETPETRKLGMVTDYSIGYFTTLLRPFVLELTIRTILLDHAKRIWDAPSRGEQPHIGDELRKSCEKVFKGI